MLEEIAVIAAGAVAAFALAVVGILFCQGRRKPCTTGQYVALGSSFAAGIGLGPRAPGSPFVCMRSTAGYPHLLARMMGLSLVDMTCSGSTTEHILHGGQVFLGPQLAAVGPQTRLVTITSGGNDVRYIGDLMFASGSAGTIGKLFWRGPKPIGSRDFARVTDNFVRIIEAIRARAPAAKIVLVGYPAVMPAEGLCAGLRIDAKMVDLARAVAEKLDDATRAAAALSGALFVDMGALGAQHDACSAEPWINGAAPAHGTAFHPTAAGAKATAEAVFAALSYGS